MRKGKIEENKCAEWEHDGSVIRKFCYRLELVSGALQKYRTIVRQKSIAQYDPVYPVISTFLEKFYRSIKS